MRQPPPFVRTVCTLAAALFTLTLAACAPAPQLALQLPTEPSLAAMRQAARDFDAALAAHDAVGMARAALLRRPFDGALRADAASAGAAGFVALASPQMFAAARAEARGDAATLAAIDALERTPPARRLLPPILNHAVCPEGVDCVPEQDLANGGLRPRGQPARIALPVISPAFDIAAHDVLWLETDVPAGNTLFVYAETNGGANVVLRLINSDSGTQEYAASEPDGRVLAAWRAEGDNDTLVLVGLVNNGVTPVRAYVTAEQTRR